MKHTYNIKVIYKDGSTRKTVEFKDVAGYQPNANGNSFFVETRGSLTKNGKHQNKGHWFMHKDLIQAEVETVRTMETKKDKKDIQDTYF